MHRALLLLAMVLGLAGPASSGEEEGPPTNLRTYQMLARRIGDSLGALIPQGDSLRLLLSVKPEGSAWLVAGGIVHALQSDGYTVVMAQPAAYFAELGVLDMHVAYDNVRRDGLFGAKIVDREVTLNIGARLVEQRSGMLIVNREFRQSVRDTVEVSEIQQLEDPYVSVTQGNLPAEGFFSSLAEPLIMLGAVAVAVYLLFTVRS